MLTQKGAMFGLDARIALAIFGTLSVVTSGYMLSGLNKFNAQGLSEELRNTHTAIERIHHDIKQDLHNQLAVKNDENAIVALYDSSAISPTAIVNKWNGPYLTRQVATHPKYGAIRLSKFQNDHTSTCSSGNLCYLWLTYASMPSDVANELNKIFDGESESTAKDEGRLQWTGSGDPVQLFFRTTRSLTIN